MSKSTPTRLFLVIVLIVVHGSLFVCDEERCWNSSFALSFEHPAHQILSWTIRQLPLRLSTIQRIAQGLIVAEGVLIVKFFLQALCSCVQLIIQVVIFSIALGLYYQISQQDMNMAFLKFNTSIDKLVYWNAIAIPTNL